MKDKINRYNELLHEITKLYLEKNNLEQEIVKEFLTDKEKYANYESEWYVHNFLFKAKNVIDFDKMKELYPEIYVLGLQPTFSKNVLLRSVDRKIAEIIIRECTYVEAGYKIKRKRKNRKNKIDAV